MPLELNAKPASVCRPAASLNGCDDRHNGRLVSEPEVAQRPKDFGGEGTFATPSYNTNTIKQSYELRSISSGKPKGHGSCIRS